MKTTSILKHELIGRDVKIVNSENRNLIGLNGRIVDETRNMLMVECNGIMKKLIKSQVILKMKQGDHDYEVNGKLLVNRPEDRIKRIRRLK